jgi:NAD dependent epimerase/dehydratase family enzyme
MILTGQRGLPENLLEFGSSFDFPELAGTLAEIMTRRAPQAANPSMNP